MLIKCYLPAVSSDCWKDIIEENVKAVDRTQGRQSFLWIKKAFGLILYMAGYLAAVVCGVSGSIPHKITDRKSEVYCVNFFSTRSWALRGKCWCPTQCQTQWPLLDLQDEGCSSMCLVIGLQHLLLPAAAERFLVCTLLISILSFIFFLGLRWSPLFDEQSSIWTYIRMFTIDSKQQPYFL